jgi:hypothetical protein
MSAQKLVDLFGLMVKAEATYKAGATMVLADDGVELFEPTQMSLTPIHTGERGNNPATGATRTKAPAVAFAGEWSPRFEFRGPGAAPSASVFAKDIHTYLRASGHKATLTAGTKWDYIPAASQADMVSVAAELYAREQKYVAIGCYADMELAVDQDAGVFFTFPTKGVVDADPTDVVVPAIIYPTLVGPRAVNLVLTVGGVALVGVQSVKLTAGRTVFVRKDLNATGHGGFGLSVTRQPRLEVLAEAAALATYNPYGDHRAATARALAFTIGTAAFNRLKFAAPNAQLVEAPGEDTNESAALTRLVFALPEDYTLTTD